MINSFSANDVALLVGIIGLVSGVMSALVTIIVNRLTLQGEIKKLKLATSNIYAENIQEKRLATYPELYGILYVFGRTFHDKEIRFDDLLQVHRAIFDWYKVNGILLSPKARDIYYRYYRTIDVLYKKGATSYVQKMSDSNKKHDLYRDTVNFNLALQADIGIFDVEFFDRGIRFDTYNELTEKTNDD